MIKDVLYSSRSDEWSTPQDLFDDLDNEFHFMIDVCASADNAKCPVYFSKEQDGLSQDWGGYGTVWCNPPYGRQIVKWIKKASDTAMTGETVVMLIHARTDTRWFHDYIYQQPNVEIRFIKGRVKFGESMNNAPFPSMIVIFRGEAKAWLTTSNERRQSVPCLGGRHS